MAPGIPESLKDGGPPPPLPENEFGITRAGRPIVPLKRHEARSFPVIRNGVRGVFTFERDTDETWAGDWYLVWKEPHPEPRTPLGVIFGFMNGPVPRIPWHGANAERVLKLMPEVSDERRRPRAIAPGTR